MRNCYTHFHLEATLDGLLVGLAVQRMSAVIKEFHMLPL